MAKFIIKDVKKGDKVYIKGFTGMKLGEYEVIAANAKAFKVAKKDGTQMTFSKETGKQTDAKSEKYANIASVNPADNKTAEDTKPAKKSDKKSDKKADTKEDKKAKKVEKDADEEETPKAKKGGKGKKKVEPAPEEDTEEDFEDELEDDGDFEDEE